jgi:hypothetical protein
MQTQLSSVEMTAHQQECWTHHLDMCESPIERTFLVSYLCLLERDALRNQVRDEPSETVVSCTEFGAEMGAAGLFDSDNTLDRVDVIVIQPEMAPFRPDFLIWRIYADPTGGEPMTSPKAIVECDGHEFHERTKEQAARDKGRDRHLQSLGYYVLRFTGSELWKDPKRCAREADEFLKDGAYRAAGERLKFPV